MKWGVRLILLFGLFLLPQTSPGMLVLQLNLEQLTHLADRIFVGRCVRVRAGSDRNGRPVHYVTYEVRETLKGPLVDRLTFKQIALQAEGERRGGSTTTVLSGLPRYQKGEEVVLFLSAPSDIGLTAPIGLLQGKFEILKGGDGQKRVMNGVRNRGLLTGLQKSARIKSLRLSSGEKRLLLSPLDDLRLNDFVSFVKKLNR